MKDLTAALAEISQLFEREEIPYAVMGGMAVRFYGLPRPTYDLDFTILCSREDLPKFYDAVEAIGYSIDTPYRDGWVDEVAGLPLIKLGLYVEGKHLDIDVFLAEVPFQQEVLRRRHPVQVDGVPLSIVSVEDLILLKILANRPRDRIDVGDVRLMQGTLDEAYLQHWAKELDIEQRFADVWRETQP